MKAYKDKSGNRYIFKEGTWYIRDVFQNMWRACEEPNVELDEAEEDSEMYNEIIASYNGEQILKNLGRSK